MKRSVCIALLSLTPLLLPACAASEDPDTSAALDDLAGFPTDGIFPRVEKAESMPDPKSLRQPESLVRDMQAIQTGTLEERLEALKRKSVDDQVFVQGGKFLMGDFGELQSNEGLPWSTTRSNKPLRKITLSNYTIGKYKVTYAEFDLYSEVNDLPKVKLEEDWFLKYRQPDVPVGVTWEQAKAYCQWLGTLSGAPFDLPTEAQWEYAARNRGKFIVWPTDDGTLTWNRNVPTYQLRGLVGKKGGYPHSIARFPPNPIGLYDLAHNGLEWVEDWFSEDYYQRSPEAIDPMGPAKGVFKVQRAWTPSNDLAGMAFDKRFDAPGTETLKHPTEGAFKGGGTSDNLRCATTSSRSLRYANDTPGIGGPGS